MITEEVHTELIYKHQLKFDYLNESYYYEDNEGSTWYIFYDNMYEVNDEHQYTLYKIKDYIGVLIKN